MSSSNNNRSNQPRRPRREPLFQLEADDIAPRQRSGPPAPLGDMLGDIDAAMPARAALPRRQPPARPTAPAPLAARASEASGSREQRAAQPALQPAAPLATAARPAAPRPLLQSVPIERMAEQLHETRRRYDDAEDDLRRVQLMTARSYQSYSRPSAPPLPSLNSWLTMGVVMLASLFVIVTLGGGGNSAMSRWGGWLNLGSNEAAPRAQLFGPAHPAGDHRLQGAPSVSAAQIDQILTAYGSPAAGSGADWYNLGVKYGIDPAFAVAFFIHESSAGTNPAWAGIKPDGGSTHNVGNIICAGYANCYGRFRDYGSWAEGIDDWYHLIDVEYIQGRGHQTVADIIPVYAPSFENDVQAYIDSVTNMVDGWRTNGVN